MRFATDKTGELGFEPRQTAPEAGCRAKNYYHKPIYYNNLSVLIIKTCVLGYLMGYL
jgi:hypothetical protein